MDEHRISEEEFQFTEEPPADTSVFAPKKAKTRFGKLNIRNILIIVVIIIFALALYKFSGLFLDGKDRKPKKPTLVQHERPQQVVIPQAVQAPQAITPQVEVPPPVQEPVQPRLIEPNLKEQLNQVQENASQNSAKINQIEQQVSNLSSTVNSIQNTLNNINDTLTTITQSLQHQQSQIEALKTKKVVHVKAEKVVHHYVPVRPVYHIQAIIPGRAWLLTPEGHTFTVTYGTVIPGYGFVRTIDPPKGIIITSTNAIIRYRH